MEESPVRLDNHFSQANQFWLVVAILLLSLQHTLAADPIKAVGVEKQLLALVNGDSIFTSDIDAVFGKMHATMSAEDKENFDYRKLLNKLVNDRLIIREAEAIGIAEDTTVATFLTNRQRDYAVRAYIAANFMPKDSITGAEILDYFRDNYRTKQLRTVSVPAQEDAARLLNLVRKGASMDSIAQAVSVDIYKYQGGLHRMKYWADIEPELRKPLVSIKDGDIVGPFPYRQVYAFMRLEKSVPADTAELAKFESYITSIIKLQKKSASWKQFMTDQRRGFRVTIDSIAVKQLVTQGSVRIDSAFLSGTERPIASVNDSVVATDRQLRQKIAHEAMSATNQPIDSVVNRVLNEQIDNAVLYRKTFQAEFDKQPSVVKKLAAARDSMLIEVYLRETVISKIAFSHQEFDQYYKEHQEEFRETDEYILKQVLFSRKELADSVVTLLEDGADFDFIANKYVEDPLNLIDKDQWVSLGSFPQQIQTDLANLSIGKTSKAYPTTDGWLVFKLKDRRPGKIKARSDAEMQIREIMFEKKFDEQMDKVLTTLKANSKIIFFNEAIDRYLGGAKR
jgi:EpsD family peptidyl-prolyl cis-trans isomerase